MVCERERELRSSWVTRYWSQVKRGRGKGRHGPYYYRRLPGHSRSYAHPLAPEPGMRVLLRTWRTCLRPTGQELPVALRRCRSVLREVLALRDAWRPGRNSVVSIIGERLLMTLFLVVWEENFAQTEYLCTGTWSTSPSGRVVRRALSQSLGDSSLLGDFEVPGFTTYGLAP